MNGKSEIKLEVRLSEKAGERLTAVCLAELASALRKGDDNGSREPGQKPA